MSKPIRILYVDDNALDRELVRGALEKEHGGFKLVTATSHRDFEKALAKGGFDLILSDFNIPGFEGLQVLETVRAKDLNLPVVIVTGTGSEETAVEALKRGASDYIIKTPKHIRRLPRVIHAVLEKKQAEEAQREIEQQYRTLFQTSPIGIGVADMQGNLLTFNDAILLPGGYTRADIKKIGGVAGLYYDPSQRNEALALLKKQGFLRNHPVQFKRKDGTAYDALLTLTPVFFQGQACLQALVEDIAERKRAEEALRDSNTKLEGIFNTMMDALITMDEKQKIISFNPAAEQMFGCPADEAIGQTLNRFVPEHVRKEHGQFVRAFGQSAATKRSMRHPFLALTCLRADGEAFPSEVSISQIEIGGEKLYTAIVRDVTERKRAEEKTLRLNRLYATLSQINQAIVRVREPEVLFEEICRVAVEFGQFRMAWIGLMDETDGLVRPVKFAGEEQGYLSSVRIKYMDESLGRGPVGTAIREGRCIVFQDIDTDPRMEPWREQALLRGYRSLAAVPFRRNNVVIGALTVYAAEPHGFDVDAENLLEEIGSDISFALDSMNAAKQRQQAENELKRLKDFNENLINSMAEGMVVQNTDGYFTFVNPATSAMTGYPPEELIGSHWTKFIPADQQEIIKETDKRRLAGEASRYEIEFLHKSGKRIHQLVSGSPLFENGQFNGTMAIFMDISERAQAQEKIRRSEEQLAAVMEGSQLGYSDWNIQKGEVQRNEHWAGMLGYTLHEIESTYDTWEELIHPDDRARARQAVQDHLDGKTPIHHDEYRMRTKDGNYRWILDHGRIIEYDAQGRPLRMTATHTDITERKLAEQQIASQFLRLKALHHIDTAIASNFDLRVTLGTLLDEVTSQLRVDAASICLFDKYMLTLEHMTGTGFYSGAGHSAKSKISESLAGRAVIERRMVHIPDLSAADIDSVNANRYRSEKFVSYYAVPLISKGQVKGVMELLQRAPLEVTSESMNFLETLAEQAAIAIDVSNLFSDLQKSNMELAMAYDATIEGWSRAMDLRDKDTEGHTLRVAEIAMLLADRLGISQEQQIRIRRGALLHDIGKLGVPDSILLKPGKLTDEEWEIMRQHPTLAYNMLQPIDYLKPSLAIPYCHHEKWDGTGYPRGLRGEQIPLDARIFAVVDVWDALRSERPYRAAWSQRQTFDYIREQSGTHFDPQIAEVFLDMIASS
ncbi:MAG: PAS domain S-box protein [Chloroflexi bacterium]|nr:PAS domain S-box protein [Chloroflexota bacterium]